MRQSYGAYRDSDVDWLERIPEHWQEQRLKTTVERSDVRVEQDLLDETPYVGLEHVSSQTGRLLPLDDGQEQMGLSNAFTCGDVLFGKLRPYLAKAFCAEFDGLCSTEFLVLRPECYERRYLLHLLLTNGFVSLADSSTFGARMPRTDWEFVGKSVLPVPPHNEQAAIASFLDHETARVDELISKQELLIERLGEYRAALITRIVTKGLPPEAVGLNSTPAFKDSGVAWLGEVPEHWSVRQFRRLLSEPLAYGANEPADIDDPLFPRYVRITDIDDSDSLRQKTFRSLPPDVAEPYLLTEGDLLLARSGATVGKSFLYRSDWGPCAYAGYLIRARMDDAVADPRYIRYFTSSFAYWAWLASAQIQATIQNVSAERYASLEVPVPPIREQREIVDHLDVETRRIDTLRAKAELSIERLSEYRSALISAAVTGKIDVREEALAGSEGGR